MVSPYFTTGKALSQPLSHLHLAVALRWGSGLARLCLSVTGFPRAHTSGTGTECGPQPSGLGGGSQDPSSG